MRRFIACLCVCLSAVVLCASGLGESEISISGGNPAEAVVYLKLLENQDFTASILYRNEWISASGTRQAEKKGILLESEDRPEINQTMLFNNGLGVFTFGEKEIHISLTDESKKFFETFGNEVPDGMPGDIITPTPSPTPGPTPTPSPTPPPFDYDPVLGANRAMILDVTADSYISGKDPTAYMPQSMTDGNEHTAWQFSTKTSKLKETYAYFSFTGPVDINQLWIKNGFWTITKGFDQYTRNSRVKELGIAYRYEGSSEWADKETFKLKDDKERTDWQKIDLGMHRNVTGVRFRIISIYKGTKFSSDVCISEVAFISGN